MPENQQSFGAIHFLKTFFIVQVNFSMQYMCTSGFATTHVVVSVGHPITY